MKIYLPNNFIKILFFLFVIFYSLSSAHAATVTYTGASGGLWSNPSNWTSSSIPTITDDVIINGDNVIVDINVEILFLKVENGGQLTINTGIIFETTDFNSPCDCSIELMSSSLDNNGTMLVAATFLVSTNSSFNNYATVQIRHDVSLKLYSLIVTENSTFHNHSSGGLTVWGMGSLPFPGGQMFTIKNGSSGTNDGTMAQNFQNNSIAVNGVSVLWNSNFVNNGTLQLQDVPFKAIYIEADAASTHPGPAIFTNNG